MVGKILETHTFTVIARIDDAVVSPLIPL